MATNKKTVFAAIFAMVMSLALVISFAIPCTLTYADAKEVDQKYAVESTDDVIGLLGGNAADANDPVTMAYKSALAAKDMGDDIAEGKVNAYKYVAATINALLSDYNDDYMAETYADCDIEGNLSSASACLENAVSSARKKAGELSSWTADKSEAFIAEISNLYGDACDELNAKAAVCKEYFANYQKEACDAVSALYASYEIQASYKAAFTAIMNEVASQSESKILSVVYDAAAIKAQLKKIDDAKAEYLKAISVLPKNAFEDAYQKFNDLIEAQRIGDEVAIAQAEEDFVSAFEKAKPFYKSWTSDKKEENKAKYTEMENECAVSGAASSNKTSTIYGDYITITAYQDGKPANVFVKDFHTVALHVSLNGASKHIATSLIEAQDKSLSTAFLFHVDVYKGTRVFVPEDGTTFKVEIKLKSYVEKYCANTKGRIQNVIDAKKYVADNSKESLSVLYAYNKGYEASVESIKCELDDSASKISFTTDNFGTICVAGTGLNGLLTNPLFYVLLVVILIVLIIIIKILVKNWKYRVSFVSNGGSAVRDVRVCYGEKIVMPEDPTKTGYIFAGWYTDKECKHRFLENSLPRRRNVRLYAKWAAPISEEKVALYYTILKDLLESFERVGINAKLGLFEKSQLLRVVQENGSLAVYFAAAPAELKNYGIKAENYKDKRLPDLNSKLFIMSEDIFKAVVNTVYQLMIKNGFQKSKDFDMPTEIVGADERIKGYDYYIQNEKVASTAEEFVSLIRTAVKSYVLDEESDKFKSGDVFTFARVYVTNEVAYLHLPLIKDIKELSKPSRPNQFEDTPVVLQILAASDMLDAYEIIDKEMTYFGFTRCPENSNDLMDVNPGTSNGFAYTIKF